MCLIDSNARSHSGSPCVLGEPNEHMKSKKTRKLAAISLAVPCLMALDIGASYNQSSSSASGFGTTGYADTNAVVTVSFSGGVAKCTATWRVQRNNTIIPWLSGTETEETSMFSSTKSQPGSSNFTNYLVNDLTVRDITTGQAFAYANGTSWGPTF